MIVESLALLTSLTGFGALGYYAVRRARLHAVSFNTNSGELEIELSDGSRYRSNGVRWAKFPDGKDAPFEFDRWLDKEYRRLSNIDRWAR